MNRWIAALLAKSRSETGRDVWCCLFIALVAGGMLHPVFHGDWPIGYDHPVHLFRIWQLRETILHHGIPWSWSHRWFAGYPQNVIYPVGTDLFVIAVQGLSLGALDLGQSYGVAFWLFYILYGCAVFYLVRRATGSRIAGTIAGVFLLTDPGYHHIGGWYWIVDLGAWTAALGMVPALFGTVWIADLFEKPVARTAAGVGACIGLALLCHQLHLVYFAMAVPLLCLCRYLTAEKTDWSRALLLLGSAVGCGLFIASFWFVPHLCSSAFTSDYGFSGKAISEIGDGITRGDVFPRMQPLAVTFGLLGSILLLKARRTLLLFMAIFVFIGISLQSSSFTGLFGPGFASWLHKQMIFPRLLHLVKPFWYGAAAFLLVTSWQLISRMFSLERDAGEREPTPVRKFVTRFAMVVFVGIFVAPIVFFFGKGFVQGEIYRSTQWHSQRTDRPARESFVAWLRSQPKSEMEFFRIAHGFEYSDFSLTDLGMEIPYPLYKFWYTPTGHFKYNLGSSTNEALRAANVRFALSEQPIDRPDFIPVRTFNNRLRLYAFRDWNPNPFEISEGSGEVRVEKFEDNEIVLQAGAEASGKLRLNVSYFPKWHATRDGVSVPITPVSLPGVEHSLFMQVPLAPGTYRFSYRLVATDFLGMALCLAGVAGCFALANWERLARRFGRA